MNDVSAPLIAVVMGSDSDWSVMQHAVAALDEFGIACEVEVLSAHRTPDAMIAYGRAAAGRGIRAIIAGAGGAAHLPGMIASVTTLPVIGVPVPLAYLDGMDSLLSIVQMPRHPGRDGVDRRRSQRRHPRRAHDRGDGCRGRREAGRLRRRPRAGRGDQERGAQDRGRLPRAVSLTSPLRHPDTRQPELMAKRAWWLLGLNLLIPGSAQLLAGDRKWGRFAVGATFVLWSVALGGLLLFALARPVALTIATNVVTLWVAQLGLIFYAVLWLATTINALSLARIVRATPRARAPLAGFVALSLVLTVGGSAWAAWATGIGRDTLGSVFAGGFIEPPIDGRYNVLLLGGDAGPDRIGLRPDSISLASVDAGTGRGDHDRSPTAHREAETAKAHRG